MRMFVTKIQSHTRIVLQIKYLNKIGDYFLLTKLRVLSVEGTYGETMAKLKKEVFPISFYYLRQNRILKSQKNYQQYVWPKKDELSVMRVI